MTAPPVVTFRGHTFHTRRTPDDLRDQMNRALDVLMAAYVGGVAVGLVARGKALRELCAAVLVPDDYATCFEVAELGGPEAGAAFVREALPAILRAAAAYEDGGESN